MLIAAFVFVCSGCQSTSLPKLLSAPAGIVGTAAQHNEEGILAYTQNQWVQAQRHFEAAIATAPHLAEAHYNLGKTLYKLNAFKQTVGIIRTRSGGDIMTFTSPDMRRE